MCLLSFIFTGESYPVQRVKFEHIVAARVDFDLA